MQLRIGGKKYRRRIEYPREANYLSCQLKFVHTHKKHQEQLRDLVLLENTYTCCEHHAAKNDSITPMFSFCLPVKAQERFCNV